MRLERSFYCVVAAFAALTLVYCALGFWAERDGVFVPAASVFCGAAAVGVIWLGWSFVRAGGEITSIATQLNCDQTHQIKPCRSAWLKVLTEALNNRLSDETSAQLKEQLKQLQIQNKLLSAQKTHIDQVIYSIRDAIIVVDEFDKVLLANEAAGRLFGFDFATAANKPVSELVEGAKPEFVDFLRQSRTSRAPGSRKEIDFDDAEGPRVFDCRVSCVCDDGGRVCAVVAVLHDITREKEIAQMKNDFVSHVSHELKTPLASIMAYSEMLTDGEANDEQTRNEFYSVIRTQAQRLNRLIEDILNIARIESGLVKVEKQPVSLAILMEEQLQMLRSFAQEKDIRICSEKPIVHDCVLVDKDMVSQVIVNLLSNAVKYTKPGGTVHVFTEVDEISKKVTVKVVDTGVGIPADELEHVFDKFYRVGANKPQAKGTGLGLSLVKQIVEKVHGGNVFVQSKVGAGSTFGFELGLATEVVTAKS